MNRDGLLSFYYEHFMTLHNLFWPCRIYFLCLNSPSVLWPLSNTLWSVWTVWHWRSVANFKGCL